ncbi:unnamed protein product [Phytomonas sp. EM1]|nr:unnamed protein product [Phytomonas sp. EM1]|eukprot:CCW64589.1 unnamed protein product [Phytomonas sp. isolate EM1]
MRKQCSGATSHSSSVHAKTGLFETDQLSRTSIGNSVVELAKENLQMINTIIDLQREREVLKARLVTTNSMKTNVVLHDEISYDTVDTDAPGGNCTHTVPLTEDLLNEIRGAIERKTHVSGCTYNGMQVVFQSMEKQAADAVVFDRDKKLQKQLMGLSQSISRSVDGDSPGVREVAGLPEEAVASMLRVVAPATKCVDQFVGLCMDLLLALHKAYAQHL